MGHLINPIAFRIGWTSNWMDTWFSEFIYYPELLHEIFRIRLYLNYFFRKRIIEKSAIFSSHFEVFLKSGFFIVRIFYYDGLFLSVYSRFFYTIIEPFFKKIFIKKYDRRLRKVWKNKMLNSKFLQKDHMQKKNRNRSRYFVRSYSQEIYISKYVLLFSILFNFNFFFKGKEKGKEKKKFFFSRDKFLFRLYSKIYLIFGSHSKFRFFFRHFNRKFIVMRNFNYKFKLFLLHTLIFKFFIRFAKRLQYLQSSKRGDGFLFFFVVLVFFLFFYFFL